MTAALAGLALAVVVLFAILVLLIIITRGYARRLELLEGMAHAHDSAEVHPPRYRRTGKDAALGLLRLRAEAAEGVDE